MRGPQTRSALEEYENLLYKQTLAAKYDMDSQADPLSKEPTAEDKAYYLARAKEAILEELMMLASHGIDLQPCAEVLNRVLEILKNESRTPE